MTAPDDRAELIEDLRAFADLLERRPDMPTSPTTYASIQFTVTGPVEADRLAEVDRIAALLGVDVERSELHATARLGCGRVMYTVHASTDLGSQQWAAAVSYVGAVEPGMAVTS